MKLLAKIDPQPPTGIKYMLGDETWLAVENRTQRRLLCEEWGNLGPMELNHEIPKNKAGFRVRFTEIAAIPGAIGFANVGGEYFWTDTDMFGRTEAERSNAQAEAPPKAVASSAELGNTGGDDV